MRKHQGLASVTLLWCLLVLDKETTQAQAASSCVLVDDETSLPRVDGSLLRETLHDVTTQMPETSLTDTIISQATRLLKSHGALVFENLVDPAVMDQLTADLAQQNGTFFGNKDSFAGAQTSRNAAKCLGESKVAQDLAIQSVVVSVVTNILQPFTKRVVLGTNSAITVVGPTAPDEPPVSPQEIHRDDSMWAGDWWTTVSCTNPRLEEWAKFPQLSVSVMWAASDFTADNGATHMALYSHLQCPRTAHPPPDTQYAQAVMPKGSVALWLGGTFHGAAAVKPYEAARGPRHGLIFIYNLGMLRSEHNFFNSIPHDVIMGFDEKLKDLLGYYGKNAVEHPWYVGPVYSQPYLGGPSGASAGGEGVQFAKEPDSLWEQ